MIWILSKNIFKFGKYLFIENSTHPRLELVIIYTSPLSMAKLNIFIIDFSSIEKISIYSSGKLLPIISSLVKNVVGNNVLSQ